MAYKVFSNGDALTGGELNTYLMNQAVISFATTTARDAALPSPSEGQLVWLEDSNKYVYYTGSAWSDLITPASSGNAIINGAFDIWQRGTSFASPANSSYQADRFISFQDGTGATRTISQQTFTPGTAPVAGYESAYFFRYLCSNLGSGNTFQAVQNRVENVRTFAGQTVTFSFWAKADAAKTITLNIQQNFGVSGSSNVIIDNSTTFSITTSWTRFTKTVAIPSITGKTIGTSDFLQVGLELGSQVITFDTWGWQLESGSTATAFKRNSPNFQAELAACQRFYYRVPGNLESVVSVSGSSVAVLVPYPVTMRTTPTSGQNITDASYSTNPGANQWGLVQAQIAWSTKSGTASSIALVGTQSNAFLQIGGATFSPTPNAIKIVSDRYLELIAEL